MMNANVSNFLRNFDVKEQKELTDFLQEAFTNYINTQPGFLAEVSKTLRSPAVNEALGEVMLRTGQAPEEAMLYGLTLYGVVADAVAEGQRIAILDKDYRLVEEVRGLGIEMSELVPTKSAAS